MNETAPARIAILLGSGLSCAAGLPGIESLSDEVAGSVSNGQRALLETVKGLTSRTHGEARDSYEDWYFVADQICQHIDRNFENPALLPLLHSIGFSEGSAGEDELARTCRALCDEITVRICLRLSDGTADPAAAFGELDEEIKKRRLRIRVFLVESRPAS